MSAGIIQLSSAVSNLYGSDRSFAESLISQFQKRGSLSEKQTACIPKLLDKANRRAEPKPSVELQNFSKIVSIFDTARERGYKKKIILRLGDEDYKVRLSEAPTSGVNAGMVYVKVNEEYKGKITRDGRWIYSGNADQTLQEKLNKFSMDPSTVARKYGFSTGSCCICGKTLTDKTSIANGIGPQCASNFGL